MPRCREWGPGYDCDVGFFKQATCEGKVLPLFESCPSYKLSDLRENVEGTFGHSAFQPWDCSEARDQVVSSLFIGFSPVIHEISGAFQPG